MDRSRFWASLSVFFPLVFPSGSIRAEGVMVISGRPADLAVMRFTDNPPDPGPVASQVRAFVTACLDYLAFGGKADATQIPKRAAFRIAYISLMGEWRRPVRFEGGYPDPEPIWPGDAGWRRAFEPGGFDAVIFGTSLDTNRRNPIQDSLLRAKGLIEDYFNRGGKLFAMAQSSYAFLPKIDVGQANIYDLDRFEITPHGHAIGMTDWVSASQTLSYRLNRLDTSVFKVFDKARESGVTWYPITVGFSGFIRDTVFVPVKDSIVQPVRASVPSGVFNDSVCVEFQTPTVGASLAYSLDGTAPALSILGLSNPGRLCFRRTTTIRLLGRKTGWIDGKDTAFIYTLQPPQPVLQVAKPLASIPSGAAFPDSLCVDFSSATPGAMLRYAMDGAIPDSTASVLPASGTLCFRRTAIVTLIGTKAGWKASDTARFHYPSKPPRPASTLALHAEGRPIEVVIPGHSALEALLTRAAGAPCSGCTVQVTSSGSGDVEMVELAGKGAAFGGTFFRRESRLPVPGDGTLQHLGRDSIVLVWSNPEDPGDVVRKSYPYEGYGDTLGIRAHNTVAKPSVDRATPAGKAWIISDAPGLAIVKSANGGSCCEITTVPVNARNPDSLRMVGLLVEASRGFSLDLKVFSHLGQFVNQVGFTVPDAEFSKLTAVGAKDKRFLRVLWNGRAHDGSRAGNGAYILKSAVTLLPIPGGKEVSATVTSATRVGLLRSRE